MKTFIGYKPFKHQKVVHDFITKIGPKAGYIIVVKSKRQIGKSYLVEQELLRHAINYPCSMSMCVSITFANCSKMFKELINGIEGSGVVQQVNNQSMTIEFINNSQIIFKSASQRDNLRGYTVKGGGLLAIDEAAYLGDDIFGLISPWVDVSHANILMVSTPRLKQGFFWNYFNEGLNQDSKNVKSFDVNDYDTSFLLSPEKLELYRKLMPKNQFISEYLGNFVDDMGSVFDMSKHIFRTNETPNDDIFIGIDWSTGKGQDYTVVSAFDSSGIQVGLDYVNNMAPNDQIQWIANIIHSKYANSNIISITCETNSIGNVYISDLKQSIGSRYNIVEFTTTNASKREIIEYMIKRINDESVKFINDPKIYAELGAYQMEVTNSGGITYNACPGQHDDTIMASAFALNQIRQLESNNYCIRFTNKSKTSKRSLYEKYH